MPYELPNTNITTIPEFLIWESGQIPILFPALLFLLFMVILGAGYTFGSKRGRGTGFSMWFAIAGIITSSVAFVLFLIHGLINIETLAIVVIITIVGAGWALFTSN